MLPILRLRIPFEQDLGDAQPRIERGVGILEDDLHRAAQRPQLGLLFR
jgi:hypothetical protein